MGQTYTLQDITLPPNHQAMGGGNCSTGAGAFNVQLVYEDPAGVGFNNPTTGAAARAVVCQVFTDLANYINTNTGHCSQLPPTLRIHILPSLANAITFPPEQNFLAIGSPYYYNYASNLQAAPSWAHGNVWRTLNGGDDNTQFTPFGLPGNAQYHGYMRFNFHPDIEWNFNIASVPTLNNDNPNTGPIRLDFYQCVLRSALQLLGMHSFMTADGSSIISNNNVTQPGLYTLFDSFLTDANTTPLLIPAGACMQVAPNPAATFATQTPCTGVFFALSGGAVAPVYTPPSWQPGISLNFLGDVGCEPFVLNKRMTGPVLRAPTNKEAEMLCLLGYSINGSYGITPSPAYATPDCSEAPICAAVDDGFISAPPHCFTFAFSCLPATINFNQLLANDHNITGIACVQGITDNVGVMLSGTTIIITDANLGDNIFSYLPQTAAGQTANPAFVRFQLGFCGNCNINYQEPCNLICNPSLSQPLGDPCVPFAQLGGNFSPYSAFCPQFPGWAGINTAYWFSNWAGDGSFSPAPNSGWFIPTPSGLNPISTDATASMLGFLSGQLRPAPKLFFGQRATSSH